MGGLGPTLFELQVRDRMQREAALRQQQQQQSATNQLQEQGNWDRAFKERDQVVAADTAKHNQALDWAKLKGQAAGISGAPLEDQVTPDEQSEAEANQAYAGATTGHANDIAKRAQAAAWAQLGFKEGNNNYRAQMGSQDRQAALEQKAQQGLLTRAQQRELAEMRNATALRGQNISDQNSDLNRAQMLEIFGDKQTNAVGKDLSEYGDIAGPLKRLSALGQQEGDLAGIGLFDAPRAAIGFGPQEGVANRRDAQMLHNAYLHALSGGAVTPTESQRAEIATGMGKMATENQFRNGVRALTEIMQQTMTNRQAKYDPSAVQRYGSRGGVTAAQLPGYKGPAGQNVQQLQSMDPRVIMRQRLIQQAAMGDQDAQDALDDLDSE